MLPSMLSLSKKSEQRNSQPTQKYQWQSMNFFAAFKGTRTAFNFTPGYNWKSRVTVSRFES